MNDGKPIEVLTDDVKDAIMKNVRRRMTPQPVKIRADVELTCFAYDGVLALQARGCRCFELFSDHSHSAHGACLS